MRSLQWKLVMILVLLVITVMVLVGTYLLSGVSGFYEQMFYTEMNQVFTPDFLDTVIRTGAGEGGVARVAEYVQAHSARLGLTENRTFTLFDGEGNYITGSGITSGSFVDYSPNLIAAMNGQIGSESNRMAPYYDLAIPVTAGENHMILYVRDNKASVSELQWMLLGIIGQALLMGLILSILLSILLSKTISRPIEDLTRGAKAVAAGDFTSKLPVYSNDEIGILTETFNSMSQTLSDTLRTVENERDKLSALFEHMTDGVAAFDRQGKLLHLNNAAKELLTGGGEETGQNFYDLFAEADIAFPEILALKRPEYRERMYSLGSRELRVLFTPFGIADGEGGVIAVIYDITEQKRLENSRREFVADITHELRTPLTNVKSYAETLISDDDIPPTTRRRFLNVILNETDRMTRLVQDLLTLSKLDYGHTDWNLETFDPTPMICNIAEAMNGDAARHNHTLTCETHNSLPLVRADRDRLGQVLANVIGNAIKYTPDGGKIHVSAQNENGNLLITVSDNGIGIPAADLPYLFNRFYRVDKARSRQSGGSGLGLAIAKEFIDRLDGNISIESEPGKGTSVFIRLPGAVPEGSVSES